MARIAGVDLPRDKRGEIAIQYIYGIGIPSSKRIFADARVDPNKRVKSWTDEETARLRDIIEREYKVEGDLRREVSMSVKRLMDIGSYRGIRHRKGLPVRGQRTHTNALARAGIGVGALPANRQALAVPDAAIRADVHEPLDAHGDLAPEIALDLVLALDNVAQAGGLLVRPALDSLVRVHAGVGENPLRRGNADTVNVLDRDLAPLVAGQIHSGDACHISCSSGPGASPGAACGADSCR